MTDTQLRDRIRAEWPKRALAAGRRLPVPPVRDGGHTAALIDLAVELAAEHYGDVPAPAGRGLGARIRGFLEDARRHLRDVQAAEDENRGLSAVLASRRAQIDRVRALRDAFAEQGAWTLVSANNIAEALTAALTGPEVRS